MEDDLRAELKEVFARDDALRADYEDWQRRKEAKAQPRIICKTYQTPPRPQRTAVMDDGLEERMRAFTMSAMDGLADIIGEETGKIDAQLLAKIETLQADLAALRADLTMLQSIVRGDVRQLKGKMSDAA